MDVRLETLGSYHARHRCIAAVVAGAAVIAACVVSNLELRDWGANVGGLSRSGEGAYGWPWRYGRAYVHVVHTLFGERIGEPRKLPLVLSATTGELRYDRVAGAMNGIVAAVAALGVALFVLRTNFQPRVSLRTFLGAVTLCGVLLAYYCSQVQSIGYYRCVLLYENSSMLSWYYSWPLMVLRPVSLLGVGYLAVLGSLCAYGWISRNSRRRFGWLDSVAGGNPPLEQCEP